MLDPQFLAEYQKIIQTASYNSLKELSRLANDEKKKRYARNDRDMPLYASLERAFRDDELKGLWEILDRDDFNPKFSLAFRLMAARGFRPGEVIRGIKAEDVLDNGDIRIISEKNKILADCHIPNALFKELRDYMEDNWIESGLIFPNCYQYFARIFQKARERAGLGDVYGETKRGAGMGKVNLFRLTMVSFRHYAVTSFYALSNQNLKATQRFARHKDPATTVRYITVRKSEIDAVIDQMPLQAVNWNEIAGARELSSLGQ